MKRLRWQLLVVLLALAAIGVLLLSQQPVTLLPGIEPEIQPISGGVYTEALIGSPGRLNPVLDYYNPADHDINRLLFSGLVRFDSRGAPVNDLADSIGISQDGSVYNFSIRSEAVWHDGEPVTSQDVIFTVELMRDEEIPLPEDLREFWEQVEVSLINEKTLQFHLPEPFAPFLDYLTFGVLPEHLLGDVAPEEIISAQFNLTPVGSGPYRFDHMLVENGEIVGVALAAFEDYYGNRPFLDQVIFRYYSDAATALAAYRQGEVMGISEVTPDVLPEVLKEPSLRLYTGRLPRITMVYLNLDNSGLPFFQDVSLRRALLLGTNRRWMKDRLLGGQAIIADGPIFPGTWAFYDGVEHLDYNPDEAIALLKAGGYTLAGEGSSGTREKDGIPLAFELVHPNEPLYTDIAEAIRRDWERLGVQVTLKAVPYDELVGDYLETRAYEAALVELNLSRSPDPDPYPFWHQAQATGGQNYSRWNDRQASEYLEQARVIVDVEERARRYRNFQVRFSLELPSLPLFYPVYSYAVDSTIQGVSMGPLFDASDRFNTVIAWYIREAPVTNLLLTPTPGTE